MEDNIVHKYANDGRFVVNLYYKVLSMVILEALCTWKHLGFLVPPKVGLFV